VTVSVVHLVRKANGPEPQAGFLEAFTAHTRADECELILACKGFDGPEGLMIQAAPRTYELRLPDVGYDLGTYRRAAEQVNSEYACFLNSFSRPLVKGWLDIMLAAAKQPRVGIVGCTGSWESACGRPFPNPHIRTNAFILRRDLFLALDMPEPRTKEDASKLEAGHDSITWQVLSCGLRAVVVNADGDKFDVDAPYGSVRKSATFRWGSQESLLVADNRTDDYQNASPERRAFLRKLAWGEA
jgi:hypothetical protein